MLFIICIVQCIFHVNQTYFYTLPISTMDWVSESDSSVRHTNKEITATNKRTGKGAGRKEWRREFSIQNYVPIFSGNEDNDRISEDDWIKEIQNVMKSRHMKIKRTPSTSSIHI